MVGSKAIANLRTRKYRRSTKNLHRIYDRLRKLANRLGYSVYHTQIYTDRVAFNYRVILIDSESSVTERIVTLSHELGHVIDHLNRVHFDRECPIDTYEDEKSAWRNAKDILVKMGAFSTVQTAWQRDKKRCLQTYYRSMREDRGLDESAELASVMTNLEKWLAGLLRPQSV